MHLSLKPENLHLSSNSSSHPLTRLCFARLNTLAAGSPRGWFVLTPLEIKQSIVAAGLEVYRTTGQEVIIADRVRDNLILDSGVRVRAGSPMEVRIIMGLRRGQYPNESDEQVFARLRALASPATSRGFHEKQTGMAPVNDPADARRTLDTYFEVILAKEEAEVSAMLELVRFALEVAQTAASRH